jgi:hypothetical protein
MFEHCEAGFASSLQNSILWAPLDIFLPSSSEQDNDSFLDPVVNNQRLS